MRRSIFEGTIEYEIKDLPAELNPYTTPCRSPTQRSQLSSDAKFRQQILGSLFKTTQQNREDASQ